MPAEKDWQKLKSGGLDGMRQHQMCQHQVTVDRFDALYISDEPDKIVKKIVKKSALHSQIGARP